MSRVGDTFLTQSQAVVNQSSQSRKVPNKSRQAPMGGNSTKTSIIQKNVTIEDESVEPNRASALSVIDQEDSDG